MTPTVNQTSASVVAEAKLRFGSTKTCSMAPLTIKVEGAAPSKSSVTLKPASDSPSATMRASKRPGSVSQKILAVALLWPSFLMPQTPRTRRRSTKGTDDDDVSSDPARCAPPSHAGALPAP